MEKVKLFIEEIINLLGIAPTYIVVIRHVVLVIVALSLAFLAEVLFSRIVIPIVLKVINKAKSEWAKIVFDRKVMRTACRIVPAVIVWEILPLVFFEYPNVKEVLARLTAVYISLTATRLIVAIIDRLKYINTEVSESNNQYFNSFCGVLKIIIIFIAAVVIIAILINKSPMSLFAGLGATSAVLMLVFKDTIEGLVAGIRLTSNKMVQVGDWITVPGTPVDGNVTEITLTTVKVKQFDNTITTVSPLTLVNGSFQNWKGMQEAGARQVKRKIYFDVRSIRLMSEEQKLQLTERLHIAPEMLKGEVVNIGVFRDYVKNYISKLPEIDNSLSLLIRQTEATQSGIPVELYFFVRITDWVPYEATVSKIFEHIYAYANEFGLNIYQQFPDQQS